MIHSMYIQCSWEQQWATCTDSRTTDPFPTPGSWKLNSWEMFSRIVCFELPKVTNNEFRCTTWTVFLLFALDRFVCLCVCVCVFFVRIWDPAGMSLDANGSSYPSKGCSQVALDRPQLTWTQVFDPGWDGGISKAPKTGGFLVRDEGNTMEYSHYLTFL